MNVREFRKAGHWPTLLCAFLYFDISFMIWVLIGALANAIAADFPLSSFEKGLMVGTPILGGAVLRLVMGLLADRIGARRTAIIGMALTAAPLLLGWLWADSFAQVLIVGLLLGVAGASFAVALPLASRWYPPQYQGLALGIAGAGNSGTSLATLFGPWLALQFGWHVVFAVALVPLLAVFGLFLLCARESPHQPPPKPLAAYVAVIRLPDTWILCLFYGVTFGGFVGLASFLSLYFHEQYGLTPTAAGGLVTVCVIAGSCLRPLGGYLADRIGGISMLMMLYVLAGLVLLDLATAPPPMWGMFLFVSLMGVLGLGNGAVFQLVPQRFPKEIGVVTGIVGAAGGVGGFCLPTLLGAVNQIFGSYQIGFFAAGLCALGCVGALFHVRSAWRGVFITAEGLAAPAGDMIAIADSPRPELSALEPQLAGGGASR